MAAFVDGFNASHIHASHPSSHQPSVYIPSDTDATSLSSEETRDASSPEPMAIVGMAMRLPGKVRNGEDFWNLLTEKRSGMCDVPGDRYNVEAFYDPDGRTGTVRMNKGYYLDDVDLQQFDTSFFTFSKAELERLDPQQRQLLQVTYECMEDSGATNWRGSKTGCYVGVFSMDWQDLFAKESQHRGGYRATGYEDFALANRISYEYDLHGPSMAVKTACSSSLVALDMACQAIRNGECDGALICGSSMIFSPSMTLALSDMGLLSPTGISHSFDASADGYARGEAVNAVYIKKLSKAIADGDNVRAVIRGTGVNGDGKTQGLTIPSPEAQEALIRQTYKQAGISDLSKTAVVECHGTGTAAGDPLETAGVAKCFGDNGILITSVKPNVGHGEGAAGLTSLIKAVLALEHRQVPPNIHFKTPNPDIPWERCGLRVPIETEDWPRDRAERMSINSFGIGGVNAHVILESARQYRNHDSNPPSPPVIARDEKLGLSPLRATHLVNEPSKELYKNVESAITPKRHLMLLSATADAPLEQHIDNHREHVHRGKHNLHDVAYTLATRRDHKAHRNYLVAGGREIAEGSPVEVPKEKPRVGWVFTGQGAQWPEMGAELIDTNPVFHDTIKKLDKFLEGLATAVPWTIESELRKPAAESRVGQAEMGHALSIAVQIGIIDVLKSWAVKPDLVLGHSSGEMAAAYASGSISAEGAMAAATFRGLTSTDNGSHRKGSMAALGIGPDDTKPLLEEGVMVACENSQSSVTISGDSDKVDAVVAKVKEKHPGVLARHLKVEMAFHSHHMLAYGALYEQHIQPFITSVDPETPMYSSVTGKRVSGDGCLSASYWRQNMEKPVLFNAALRNALKEQDSSMVLIEIGPHPALKGPIGQILRDIGRADTHVGSLIRGKSCEESLLHMGGTLFQHNVDMDISSLVSKEGKHIHGLPQYPWKQESKYWAEPRISRDWRFRQHRPHELLGLRVMEVPNENCWRNKFMLEDAPWIEGHIVDGEIVMPGAGYVCMIGEAIRQLHDESSYSIKNMSITAGLVLGHEKTVEIVTRLTQITVESADESAAYSFAITSYDGTRWIKHCSGEVRPSFDKSHSIEASFPAAEQLPRRVDAEDWYTMLSRVGFNYTGAFRGLKDVFSSTTAETAVATVPNSNNKKREPYSLHPAVIDQCFQLFTVSACRGLRRKYSTIAVPTFIQEIVVRPADQDLRVKAEITNMERGSFHGHLSAQNNGRNVLTLKGFKASALTSNAGEEAAAPLISQIHWRPHRDFVKLGDYLHPSEDRPKEWPLMEELLVLASLDHVQKIRISSGTPTHLIKFFDWMTKVVDWHKQGPMTFIGPEAKLWDLNDEARLARINEIVEIVAPTEFGSTAVAIHRLFLNATAIFAGEAHALHILLKDNLLNEFYAVIDTLDFTDAIRTLAHTNPQMRVLEVGAGTGGTTTKVLAALTSPYGERMYSRYVYTDISTGFMNPAKERFAGVAGMEYAGLDISQDPSSQGFVDGTFDLIVGANVVHATPSLNTSLRNLRRLLKPTGRIFLEELCPEHRFINYIMGFLSGWWLGEEDGRHDQPYVGRERWTQELVKAGFKEPEAYVLDGIAPYHQNAGIMAAPAVKQTKPSTVTLLCHSTEGPYFDEMKTSLEAQGISVEACRFGDELPRQDIVSILDLQESTLYDLTETNFNRLIKHLKELNTNLVWVTPSAQISCNNPKGSLSIGLARTARNEFGVKLYTVEIDIKTPNNDATNIISQILLHVQDLNHDNDGMDSDWEYAIVNGETLVPRWHWQTMSEAFAQECEGPGQAIGKTLTIKTPGMVSTMGWTEIAGDTPGYGQVVVQVKATGLNFRDVLIALGVLDNSTTEIGLEGSGIVTAVGEGVERLSVGDRVIYLSSGCFATHLTVKQELCVKINDSISFEQGATIPCVYTTAVMALTDKANLRRGQTVLIHSACGGVGLAAIQIAQMLGAEIYCTVSSQQKIDYIMENYGIPLDHICNSRDSSFVADVMKHTNGEGVDVVLNSLSGDLLHASWDCLADFGTMIEIGKRDFRRRAKLSMEAFEQNRTFVGLDLWQISQVRPARATELLERCVSWIQMGLIKAGAIAEAFDATQVQDAFRFMQGGKHIGKIVITMPEDTSSLESSPYLHATTLRPDRSYLLVGGLGGLGRSVATWMVERGARYITFLSRSAKQDETTAGFVKELESQGCEVQLAQGSVSDSADVQNAVANAAKPIAGAVNLSMVLRDVGLKDMKFDDWKTVAAPKVQGTWNLDAALGSDLDFFVVFSSFSGLVGQWGQANYAAANTFLDSFVEYRHSLGRAASVIDVGVVGEVGFVSKNKDVMTIFKQSGIHLLKETDLLDSFSLAIQRSKAVSQVSKRASLHGAYWNPSQIILGVCTDAPINSPSTRVVWKKDVRMSILHNRDGGDGSTTNASQEQDEISQLLASAASDATILGEESTTEAIAVAIAGTLADFLIKDKDSVKVEQSPEQIGVDSLVAMELRNWIRQKFGVETNAMSIVQSSSLLALADHIRESLVEKFKEQEKIETS